MNKELPPTISFSEFEIDSVHRRLMRDGEVVALNAKAFDLLEFLANNSGAIVTKEEILQAVWDDKFVEESNLVVQISNLRKALGEPRNAPRFLVTVPGKGYKFVADVSTNDVVIETHTVSELIIQQEEIIDFHRPSLPARPVSTWKWLAIAGLAVLAIAGIGWYLGKGGQSRVNSTAQIQTVNSIAVLPFQFVNAETQNEAFELGLTESLINRLSGLKDISVRPLSAVKKYKRENRDLNAIGKEQKVDSVLEGNIQLEGNKIRLTVSLLNAANGTTIWNEQIDDELSDIFLVQDKISNRVATSLQIILSDAEKKSLAKSYTQNIDAYKKYLIARHYWDKRNPTDVYESIKVFNQAIDLDPTFALAYAGLADSYLLIGLYDAEPTTEAFPKARAAAEKALEIDGDLAEAEVSLAMVSNLFEYDWNKAEGHFQHAIELKPSYSTGHHWFGLFLAMQGRSQEALLHLNKAKELDPLSLSINTDVAFAYFLANRSDDAIDQLNKTLVLNADFPNTHNHLGMNYLVAKRFDDAVTEFENAKKLSGGDTGAVELIWANGFSGNIDRARTLLAEFPKDKNISPFDMAVIYTSFGEKEKAIEYLENAYEKKDPLLVAIKVFPPFELLRQEAKFNALLKKMNL